MEVAIWAIEVRERDDILSLWGMSNLRTHQRQTERSRNASTSLVWRFMCPVLSWTSLLCVEEGASEFRVERGGRSSANRTCYQEGKE